MSKVQIEVVQLEHGKGLPLPKYATSGSSGMDLHAAVETEITVFPKSTVLVPTGLIVSIPPGFEGQVRPRSGLALKHGIMLPNSPGTIDSDYRGEIKVILHNASSESFIIRPGDRIAQMVIAPVVRCEWIEVVRIKETGRNSGGFGHTGVEN